jgi:hypothetical protein
MACVVRVGIGENEAHMRWFKKSVRIVTASGDAHALQGLAKLALPCAKRVISAACAAWCLMQSIWLAHSADLLIL